MFNIKTQRRKVKKNDSFLDNPIIFQEITEMQIRLITMQSFPAHVY